MSAKRNQHHLSLRQNRQNSKLERLLKFIQSNSPVKITHDCNSNTIKTFAQNTQEKRNERDKEGKGKIQQVINLFLEKKKQGNSRQNSLTHTVKRQSQEKLKSQTKIVKNDFILPMIRIVKTEQAQMKLDRNGEEMLAKILGNKKYESLLLLPKQVVGKNLNQFEIERKKGSARKQYQNSQKKVFKHTKTQEFRKSIEERKSKKIKSSIKNANENNYTGWQTTIDNDQRQFHLQYQFDNISFS